MIIRLTLRVVGVAIFVSSCVTSDRPTVEDHQISGWQPDTTLLAGKPKTLIYDSGNAVVLTGFDPCNVLALKAGSSWVLVNTGYTPGGATAMRDALRAVKSLRIASVVSSHFFSATEVGSWNGTEASIVGRPDDNHWKTSGQLSRQRSFAILAGAFSPLVTDSLSYRFQDIQADLQPTPNFSPVRDTILKPSGLEIQVFPHHSSDLAHFSIFQHQSKIAWFGAPLTIADELYAVSRDAMERRIEIARTLRSLKPELLVFNHYLPLESDEAVKFLDKYIQKASYLLYSQHFGIPSKLDADSAEHPLLHLAVNEGTNHFPQVALRLPGMSYNPASAQITPDALNHLEVTSGSVLSALSLIQSSVRAESIDDSLKTSNTLINLLADSKSPAEASLIAYAAALWQKQAPDFTTVDLTVPVISTLSIDEIGELLISKFTHVPGTEAEPAKTFLYFRDLQQGGWWTVEKGVMHFDPAPTPENLDELASVAFVERESFGNVLVGKMDLRGAINTSEIQIVGYRTPFEVLMDAILLNK